MSTKEKVLQSLTEAKGQAISGEELAENFNVSRAAIWKAVKALRSEGILIEGTTNGGYILSDDDIFDSGLFEKTFSSSFPEFSDSHLECHKEIDSTITYAKRLLAECGNLRSYDGSLTEAGKRYHKSVILAEKQTAGRGRLGRTFVSPEKSGVYLSVIYAPKGGITNPASLTAFTAVGVCRAIKKLYGLSPKIKWINDLFAGGKKICGILAEGITNFESGIIESAIVGIGINLKQSKAISQAGLQNIAGSIEEALKTDSNLNSSQATTSLNRIVLASEVAGQILRIFENTSPESKTQIMEEYRAASFLLGQEITVFPLIGDTSKSYKARSTSIDDNAGLIVTLSDGTSKTLSSGEVSLKSDVIAKL